MRELVMASAHVSENPAVATETEQDLPTIYRVYYTHRRRGDDELKQRQTDLSQPFLAW